MSNSKSGIVRIEKPGNPDVLKYELMELPQPEAGEVLISQKAIGVNFLDTFFRYRLRSSVGYHIGGRNG